MTKQYRHQSQRFRSQWFLKCFEGKKVEHSPVWAEAVPSKKSERVSQRKATAPKKSSVVDVETKMLQCEGRIRWKRAKRLLCFHRMTEGCIPKLQGDISTTGGEERDEGIAIQESPPERSEVDFEPSPTKDARNRTSSYGDETPCIDHHEGQKSSKLQDAACLMNLENGSALFQKTPLLAEDHDQVVRESEWAFPAPYEVYKDSCGPSIGECNSLCALGCQYGDECTMRVRRIAGSETHLNNAPNSSEPESMFIGCEESVLDRRSSATTDNDNIHDGANDVLPKAYIGAGIRDELECLTPGTSKPSSAEGSSYDSSPLSVFSSAKVGAVQEDASTCVGSKVETEQHLSRDDALISNGIHLEVEDDEAQVRKLPPFGLGYFPGEHLHCESFGSASPFVNNVEKGGMSSIPSSDTTQRFNGENEEVKQVRDVNEKVLAELCSSLPVEKSTIRVKDVEIDAKPTEVNLETLSVKDPEMLSCPHIQQLPYKRPDYAVTPDAKPGSNGSLVVGNGMEASSGILHLRRPASAKSRNFQYPPSTRDYRLQRRIERFHRYFEEFLETERVAHDTAHRNSQMANRVRRFFEDESSDGAV